MARVNRWAALASALALVLTSAVSSAATPVYTEEVTDYGRNPWRTHYTPTEPEYPLTRDAKAIWEVPLGLSRSQPLVVSRDFNGDGKAEIRIYHIAGDRLWALNGDLVPKARGDGQGVESYRQQLRQEGFILWDVPATEACSARLTGQDSILSTACAKWDRDQPARPFASSQAAYSKGAAPAQDVIYVGFGHPASVMAIRAKDGQPLGATLLTHRGDRGIVGAPLVFPGDRVVVGTTDGRVYIISGLAAGAPFPLHQEVGGRISFSPVPIGSNAFIVGSDARVDARGVHGYLGAYYLGGGGVSEFDPYWAANVKTPSGIPAEAAIDANTVYFSDKWGRMYALRLDTGELLWCRQFPGLGACEGAGTPGAFINNGPGVDEDKVYFVFRNNAGPNQGGGQVVALNKATGQVSWTQPMDYQGNTAPVPMGNIVIVGDTGGNVQAYDKTSGEQVTYGGYPLILSREPYQSGAQGEQWWEPIGGTATQMTVAAGMMLVGVNSVSEERTVLKAYRLHRLPDLTLAYLNVPESAGTRGFEATVRAVCYRCAGDPIETTVSLSINGREVPRRAVTFRAENGWAVNLSWDSGPLPAGNRVTLVATVDPDDLISESDETNNTLRATVGITAGATGTQNLDGWGSDLSD